MTALPSFLFLLIFVTFVGTIGSVGIIFAQTEFCLPSTALAALVLMITFLALAGNLLFLKLQQRFDLSAKFMMVLMLSISCILPLWGIIGLFSQSFGLRSIGEVFGFSFLYGLILGSLQSYSRTLFCSVIPKGSESQFFGLYEITDKGSSWIGPLVLSAVYAKTGELRYALIFLFFMLFIPCVMISFFVDFEEGKKAAGRSVANTSASEQELGKAGESN
jgi:UMF1 family MFS transporter